ncbi:cytochrome P450 [Halioxenophilus aromaticivorans]|uniref:Cytochrome P450 n=1 Tax=Halioxenophilus aromaticivorans TaxID=1306992 RepID=A0AAV3TXB5_9ALTE
MTVQAALNPRGEKPAHVPDELVIDFDIYNPPGLEMGFHEAWKALHAEGLGDILWTPCNGGHWLTARASVMSEVLSQYETFSSKVIIVPKTRGEEYGILPTHLSPPEHRPYRALLNTGLSPKRIRALTPAIHRIIHQLVEDVRLKGQCNFMEEVAVPFPTSIVMMILGLPIEDGPYLKTYADHIMRPDGTVSITEAYGKLKEYLKPYMDARKENPTDDMISGLVNGTIEGESLSENDAYELCLEVVIAGLDTVVNFLSFIMYYLANHPEERKRLVGDPSLIPAAADEFVRRFGLVVVGRHVEHDTVFNGVEMKSGEMVINATFLPALDERVNPGPMDIDFDRSSVAHITFGAGPHRCAGAPLARVEVIAALNAWLSRIPDFTVTSGTKPTFKAGTVGSMEDLHLSWDPFTTTSMPIPE